MASAKPDPKANSKQTQNAGERPKNETPPKVLAPAADPAVVRKQPSADVAKDAARLAVAPPSTGQRRGPPRTAIVVVHGIGQQLPFQTLGAFASGLRKPAPKAAPHAVRLARVGGTDLPRVELDLEAEDGTSRPTHLYEAYWAPLTEGKITVLDVILFLLRAAWNGWRKTRWSKPFARVMFDKLLWLSPSRSTRWHLPLAGLVVLALVVLNAVTTMAFAATVFEPGHSRWFDESAATDVTAFTFASIALAVACLVGLRVTRWFGFFFAALAALVIGAVAILFVLGAHAFGSAGFAPSARFPWLASPWFIGGVWSVLTLASLGVRTLLVQFVGDVAAYITPQYVDRFLAVRDSVKKAVCDVVHAVYRHRDDDAPAYEHVVVVGHSLGSVAAYDALNAALNKDLLEPQSAVGVLARTKLLLTFGSPLDKTAYIFTTRGRDEDLVRESLAAAVQPLIQHETFRAIPWVNVHSRADIVSGSLDFYDDPGWPKDSPLRVRNIEDEEAKTPLVAHVEYWNTQCIFDQVRKALGLKLGP